MFLGLDMSLTGTGFVVIDNKYNILEKEILHVDARDTERLLFIEEIFLKIIDPFKSKLKLVGIETPAFRAEGHLFDMGELSGVLKLHLFKMGIHSIGISPFSLKKYITGSAKEKIKSVIILDLFKNFGVELRNDNLADAYALARIAHNYYNLFLEKKPKKILLQKYQIDVLNNLVKTNKKEHLL